jgi:hypothetical protein
MCSVIRMHCQQLKNICIGFTTVATQAKCYSASYISDCRTKGPPTRSYQGNWRMEMGSSRADRCTDHCDRCVFRQCLLVLTSRFPVLTPRHLYLWNERMSLCTGKNRTDDIKSHTLMVHQRPRRSSMFCLTTSSPMQEDISNSKPSWIRRQRQNLR